jgi:hypothetical protein
VAVSALGDYHAARPRWVELSREGERRRKLACAWQMEDGPALHMLNGE